MKYTKKHNKESLFTLCCTAILCIIFCFPLLSFAFSDESVPLISWDISQNEESSVVAAIYEKDGKYHLIISGNGNMKEFNYSGEIPWTEYSERIVSVDVKEGVKNLSEYLFSGCSMLSKVVIREKNIVIRADVEFIPFTVDIYAHLKSTVYFYVYENYPSRFYSICEFADGVCTECGYECVNHTGGKASCTDGGKCEICSKEYIPPLEHELSSLITEKEALCYEFGVAEHYECLRCHALFDTSGNPTTEEDLRLTVGHDYGELIKYVEPDCFEGGVLAHYQCSMCFDCFDEEKNKLDNIFVSKLEHSGGDATCLSGAVCEKCGETYTDVDSDKHSFGVKPNYDGLSHWFECLCGIKVGTSSHSLKQTVTKNPTEQEEGTTLYFCDCGFSYTERIPKLEPEQTKDNKDTGNEENNYASLTIIISSASVLGLGALVLVLAAVRKCKRS